jgi:hypothetical protein
MSVRRSHAVRFSEQSSVSRCVTVILEALIIMIMTILKMEAADSSEIGVHLYQTPKRRIKKINRPPYVKRKCHYGKWFQLAKL